MSVIDFFGDLHRFQHDSQVGLTTVTPPTVEPVSVDQVIAQINSLDESNTAQVNLLPVYISSARERAEAFCNRTFPIQTRMMTLDRFPLGRIIRLRRPPIIAITSITYLDPTTQVRTMVDPSTYLCDLDPTAPRVYPTAGNHWPHAYHQPNNVQITYTCGYSTVPSSAIHAILLMAADGYQLRQSQILSDHGVVQNQAAADLLYPLRTF